jgi:hypothetical protein
MIPYLKGILLFALVAGAAAAAIAIFVPDVVPIADIRQAQPYLPLAFALKTIELTSAGGMILTLIAALPAWTGKPLHELIRR